MWVMSLDDVTAIVIGDVAVVLGLSSLLGAVARRFGQPAVIGQLLAGVLLGPSFLGRLPGHLTSHLFPHAEYSYLAVLSQVAIVIFMFLVGYEMDFRSLHGQRRAPFLIAIIALLVPMGLGSGSTLLFPSLFAASGAHHVASHSFVLFVGVATSITALPVLAAIVRERGIAGSRVGVIATAAAGAMDVIGWIVLAAAVASSQHPAKRSWLVTFLLISGWAAIMLFAVRPVLRWLVERPGALLSQQVPVAIVLATGNACVTALLGLHAIFGGLLAGLTMPRPGGAQDADVVRSMESASSLLLPLFFVVTGLSLNIGLLRVGDLELLALIFAIACAGKLGPAYGASRLGGLAPRPAAAVAVLLNTRGLTELIALNVGLQSGIISSRLFTIFVLMALVTTALTSPLLSLIGVPKQPPVTGTEQATAAARPASGLPGGLPDQAGQQGEAHHAHGAENQDRRPERGVVGMPPGRGTEDGTHARHAQRRGHL